MFDHKASLLACASCCQGASETQKLCGHTGKVVSPPISGSRCDQWSVVSECDEECQPGTGYLLYTEKFIMATQMMTVMELQSYLVLAVCVRTYSCLWDEASRLLKDTLYHF